MLVWTCLLIPLIKCLKGHKSLGSLCSVVKTLIVSLVRQRDRPRDRQCHLLSCSGQLKMQDFCTKMKFPPLYMIFRGTGASQHYLVGFLSLLSPQARGASVMSLQFQSVCNGICDEISGPRLRSYPAIFTGQGHINKVFPVSECLKLFFNKIFGKC